MTLTKYLAEVSSRDPSRALIIFEGTIISAIEFQSVVSNFAEELRSRGIQSGDRFAYCGENHPLVLAAIFAAARIDATLIPISAANSVLAHVQVEKLKAKILFTEADAGALWSDLRRRQVSNNSEPSADTNHARIIFSTSGTSGVQKFVALPESHLIANIETAIETQKIGRDDVVMATLSICHSGGLCIQTLPTVCAGGTLILARSFSLATFRDLTLAHNPTMTLTVPSHLQLMKLSSLWGESVLEKFRLIGIGSALLSASLARASQMKRLRLMNIYGLTEAGPCAVAGWIGRSAVTAEDAVSIGHAQSGVSISLSNGDSGEIRLRGDAVNVAYIDDSGTRVACDADGWFSTGDIGFRNGDEFFLIGRNSEFLNVGGMKMHPGEIENVVAEMPGVRACAIVTRTHLTFGEILVAYVELEPGTILKRTAIVRFCKDRLARYKVPREIVLVAALPRSAIGKILKAKLVSGAA